MVRFGLSPCPPSLEIPQAGGSIEARAIFSMIILSNRFFVSIILINELIVRYTVQHMIGIQVLFNESAQSCACSYRHK